MRNRSQRQRQDHKETERGSVQSAKRHELHITACTAIYWNIYLVVQQETSLAPHTGQPSCSEGG